jgi:hypothetical protein
MHPAHGKDAEHERKQVQQQKDIPLINDECRCLCYETIFFLLCHGNTPLSAYYN